MGNRTAELDAQGDTLNVLRYNLLNLPEEYVSTSGETVKYVYNADGEKLYMQQTTSSNTTQGTEYAANYRIDDGMISMIHTDAGYYTPMLIPPGSAVPEYGHLWYLKDHLGNNRVLVSKQGAALASYNYDPFGESIAITQTPPSSFFPPTATESPYRYGGKEWNATSLTYDFEARYLSPGFHRFTTMDPLCEKYYSISPYAYCAGNPVNLVDPDGRTIYIWYGENNKDYFRYTGAEDESSIPDNAYVQAVIEAYKYNKNNWKRAGFDGESPSTQMVERKDIIVSVFADNVIEDRYYRGNGGFQNIIWNPTEGTQKDLGIILSPATLFAHEADHSLDDAEDAKAHSERVKETRTDGYTNDEEYRVINGSEQLSALANGEIKAGQRTRRNHSGKTVFTKGPTSTVIVRKKRK